MPTDPRMVAIVDAQRALKASVKSGEMTPAEAEQSAVGRGFDLFPKRADDLHDIIKNSTWWLPIALLFYSWRDLSATRREYERLMFWGRDLWRDSHSEAQVMTLGEAEDWLRNDLTTGIVRAFGTNSDHEAVAIPPNEWRHLSFAGSQPLSACRDDGTTTYTGVFVLRHEVVPLWLGEAAPERRERSDTPPPRRSGGRPPLYDWDAMWIEVVRLAIADKITDRPALSKHLLGWFSERFGAEPGESIFKEKMAKLFKSLDWE